MQIAQGTDIGRYHVLQPLGEGGMAFVYKAYDTHLDCEVALKIIRLENLPANRIDKTIERFEREAKRMARLTHSNIVKVIDYGEYEGIPYLVMPLISGGTLKERMGRPMTWSDAVRIIEPIADALNYAHSKGIIHRDIKPSNILVTESGTPMLSDFGIAKILDDENTRELTTTGVGIGTPEYMAPEQATGVEIDERADIYALGVVLYEMIAGRRPFEATTPMAVLIKQARDPLPRPSQFNGQITARNEQILIKALAKNPENRYQSMGDFLSALKEKHEPEIKPSKAPYPDTIQENRNKYVSQGTNNKKKNKSPSVVVILLGVVAFVFSIILFGRLDNYVQNGEVDSTDDGAITAEEVSVFDEQLKVAALVPLTGPVPTYGESVKNGISMAVEEWNADGGVLGKEIVLVFEDSQCSADPAVDAANKVIYEDEINYIIGEVCSSASIPVAEIAERESVLQISPTSTNIDVTLNSDGSTRDTVFRACFIDPFQGTAMAKFARNQGYSNAYVMYDPENDYVRGIAEVFVETFEEYGGSIVGSASYDTEETDFTLILEDIESSGAEILCLPDYYRIVSIVSAQIKTMGLDIVVIGGDVWDSADLDLEATDGYYYINHYSPYDSRKAVVEWVEKYSLEYGAIPDALATIGYDAANMLFTSIEKAGVDDPVIVADAMESLVMETVSGIVSFDEYHNPIKNSVVLQVNDNAVDFVASVNP